MMGEAMYYKSSAMYQRGEIINPGNWGRMLMGRGGRHSAFYREYLLERLREREFPSCPSRLIVAFALENSEFAHKWQRGAPEILYRVRLADAGASVCRLDMSWIDVMNDYHSFSGVEDVGRHYWRGDVRQPDAIELLISGAVIIEERMTKIPENGQAV